MDKLITGKAFVLGDNVDTDQIIPAEYLAYDPSKSDERKYFGMYACAGVPDDQSGLPDGATPFVEPGRFDSDYTIVIGGKNFGCGSSREHAPLALAEAGARVVVAEFFARIFYRNCVNGGYMVPLECEQRLCELIRTGEPCQVDLEACTLTNQITDTTYALGPLGDALPIIEAGGVIEYARQTGMLSR